LAFFWIFYKFLRIFEVHSFWIGGGLWKFYKDALRTFEILALIPLARRGRRAEGMPANFRWGDGEGSVEKWSVSTRRSRRTRSKSWEGKGMTGVGFPMVAEAAAEGCSSARRFPARRRAKLGLESYSKARGS
jgi:hypothetical protein